MIEVTLQSGEEISLPVTVDDVPANQWFAMSAFERELEALGADCEPGDFVHYVTAAVKSVVEMPDTMAFGLPAKTLKNKEWELTPLFIASVEKKGVETIEATVLNIYRHLLWVVRTFQPCEFPIELAGREWNMTPNLRGLAFEGEFTAQETVETLVLEQMFETELAEARKAEMDFSRIVAADYGLSQVKLAVLLRPVGEDGKIEPLPMGEKAIERYIGERVADMEGLPYSIVLSVRFFFLNILTLVSALSEMVKLRAQLSTPHSG